MSSPNSTPISGVSQRASDIARENRESRQNVSDEDLNLVHVQVPRSLAAKVEELMDFTGLSAKNLFYMSVHLVLSYAKAKSLKIQDLQGYPDQQEFHDVSKYKLELSQQDFQELQTQELLEEVSQCVILV